MQRLRKVIGVFGASVLAFGLTACQSNRSTSEPAPAQAEPQPETRPVTRVAYYRPTLRDGQTMAELAFPTGSVGTSAILIHQVMPASAQRGADFTYEYHVTNLTNVALQNVVLTQESSNNLEVVNSSAIAANRSPGGGRIFWNLGDLGANRTEVIRVTARADEIGRADNCVTVSYNNFLCASLPIVQPDLTIAKRATARAFTCDEIELTYRVCNPGTGVARNVVVADTLPEGLTVGGRNSVRREFASIAPGDCEEFTVIATAARSGQFASAATATAAGDLTASSEQPQTVVVQPNLIITSECRDQVFLTLPFQHSYTVTNTGDGPSQNTSLVVTLPAGVFLREVPAGATVEGQRMTWNLGTIAPNANRTVSFMMNTSEDGTYATSASVEGDCAPQVTTRCSTEVLGIPAVLLEVVDVNDPVLVGMQTTYRIVVTNQGSARDRNIRINCVLPAQQRFVSAGGPTQHRVDGQTVSFAPLGVLEVGQEVEWTVTIEALAEGDVRFSVSLDTDELTSSVNETEATRQFR